MSTSPSIFDQYRQSVAALPPPPTPNLAGMAGPTSPGGVPSNLNIPMPATPNVTEAPTQLQKDQGSTIKNKDGRSRRGAALPQDHRLEIGPESPHSRQGAGRTGGRRDRRCGYRRRTRLGEELGSLAEEQIPGTLLNHQVQLNRAGKDITTDEANAGKEAQTASENATAAKTTADTAEVAPEAEARIGQENATAALEFPKSSIAAM